MVLLYFIALYGWLSTLYSCQSRFLLFLEADTNALISYEVRRLTPERNALRERGILVVCRLCGNVLLFTDLNLL